MLPVPAKETPQGPTKRGLTFEATIVQHSLPGGEWKIFPFTLWGNEGEQFSKYDPDDYPSPPYK